MHTQAVSVHALCGPVLQELKAEPTPLQPPKIHGPRPMPSPEVTAGWLSRPGPALLTEASSFPPPASVVPPSLP